MSAAPGEVGSEVHDVGPDACPWCLVPPGEVTAGMDSDLLDLEGGAGDERHRASQVHSWFREWQHF